MVVVAVEESSSERGDPVALQRAHESSQTILGAVYCFYRMPCFDVAMVIGFMIRTSFNAPSGKDLSVAASSAHDPLSHEPTPAHHSVSPPAAQQAVSGPQE